MLFGRQLQVDIFWLLLLHSLPGNFEQYIISCTLTSVIKCWRFGIVCQVGCHPKASVSLHPSCSDCIKQLIRDQGSYILNSNLYYIFEMFNIVARNMWWAKLDHSIIYFWFVQYFELWPNTPKTKYIPVSPCFVLQGLWHPPSYSFFFHILKARGVKKVFLGCSASHDFVVTVWPLQKIGLKTWCSPWRHPDPRLQWPWRSKHNISLNNFLYWCVLTFRATVGSVLGIVSYEYRWGDMFELALFDV